MTLHQPTSKKISEDDSNVEWIQIDTHGVTVAFNEQGDDPRGLRTYPWWRVWNVEESHDD
jgi:hypothetical protein